MHTPTNAKKLRSFFEFSDVKRFVPNYSKLKYTHKLTKRTLSKRMSVLTGLERLTKLLKN